MSVLRGFGLLNSTKSCLVKSDFLKGESVSPLLQELLSEEEKEKSE